MRRVLRAGGRRCGGRGRKLFGRTLPLLSLFAAFSFVTMMFNLPLPGGTTGHAVGVGIAAIVLGPWASLLAISLALAIQALFFGDGGITTLGANCFNMAIVGSFAAWGIYRLVSLGAAAESRRRVMAAALAGYGAINLSALLAAIEFGIQPMLFPRCDGRAALCALSVAHCDSGDDGWAFDDCRSSRGGDERGTVQLSAAQRAGAGGDVWRVQGALGTRQRMPLRLQALGQAWTRTVGSAGGGAAADAAWNSGQRCGMGRVGAEGFCERCDASADGGGERTCCAADGGTVGAGAMANLWTAPMPDYAPHFVKSAGVWISAVGDVWRGADSCCGIARTTHTAIGPPIRKTAGPRMKVLTKRADDYPLMRWTCILEPALSRVW